MNPPAELLRALPHSTDCEEGLVGSALLDPKTVLPEVMGAIGSGGESFYSTRCRTLWHCLCEMFDRADPIDPVTVTERLRASGKLRELAEDDQAAVVWITGAFTRVPTAGNFAFYLDQVMSDHRRRQLIEMGTSLVTRAYEPDHEVEATQADHFKQFTALDGKGRDVKSARDLVREAMADLQAQYESKSDLVGLDTGFPDLNHYTRGLHPAELTIIAARPGCGKTSFACDIVKHAALRCDTTCGIFSLEMTGKQLMSRMMASEGGINLQRIRYASAGDFTNLTSASSRLVTSQIFVDDSASLKASQIRARARSMQTRCACKLLVVDYLQQITREYNNEDKFDTVSNAAKQMKAVASELGVPLILLCQLNRAPENEARRPRISDLRASGEIEECADNIMLMSQGIDAEEVPEGSKGLFSADDLKSMTQVHIAKQRNGPCTTLALRFRKEFTRFETVRWKKEVSDGHGTTTND